MQSTRGIASVNICAVVDVVPSWVLEDGVLHPNCVERDSLVPSRVTDIGLKRWELKRNYNKLEHC